jgi:hypothetical protein
MKPGSKRRRTRTEIDEQREDEALQGQRMRA